MRKPRTQRSPSIKEHTVEEAQRVAEGGHVEVYECSLGVGARRRSDADELVVDKLYSLSLLAEHSEAPAATTAMHLLGVDGMAALPSWFAEAMGELVDRGVSQQEINDAVRAGPRFVDGLFARYRIEVPPLGEP